MNGLLDSLSIGLSVALSGNSLLFCLIGTLIGTVIGVLPGLGPVATMAMLLPLTFYVEPTQALIMLAGIYYGAQYGGSTTAILLKLPGEVSSVVTCIDGHEMAKKGRAGAALAIAAIGSLFAGTVATLLIALFSPPLTALAQSFGPADYFALMALGLLASIIFSNGDVLRAILMILLGVLLGTIGTDINSGFERYVFGVPQLREGLTFIVVSMGIYGIAEIVMNLAAPDATKVGVLPRIGKLWPSRQELKEATPAVVRGTAVGAALGILPGGGAMLSSFASYAIEKKVSKKPEEFGRGAVAGLAGPEAANNAGAQSSFIPMLALGIPGNSVMAMLAGAMLIHGISPSPALSTEQPQLFWGLIVSMWIGNIMLVVINLPLVGLWVRLLSIPYRMLFPAIIVLCCIGVYSVNSSTFDIMAIAVCGLVGVILSNLKCPVAPFALSFILSPMLEENFRRAMQLARGDITVFATRPVTSTILLIGAALAVLLIMPSFKRVRSAADEA